MSRGHLKMRPTGCLETSLINHPVTRRHILELRRPQKTNLGLCTFSCICYLLRNRCATLNTLNVLAESTLQSTVWVDYNIYLYANESACLDSCFITRNCRRSLSLINAAIAFNYWRKWTEATGAFRNGKTHEAGSNQQAVLEIALRTNTAS